MKAEREIEPTIRIRQVCQITAILFSVVWRIRDITEEAIKKAAVARDKKERALVFIQYPPNFFLILALVRSAIMFSIDTRIRRIKPTAKRTW